MDFEVHKALTREWAEEVGFSPEEAQRLGTWCMRVDIGFPGRAFRFKKYHHAYWGAADIQRRYFSEAIETGSLPHLAVAIHASQDSIGHGRLGWVLHWPGIDKWHRRSRRIRQRIEAESKMLMRDYLELAPSGREPEGARSEAASLPLPPDATA